MPETAETASTAVAEPQSTETKPEFSPSLPESAPSRLAEQLDFTPDSPDDWKKVIGEGGETPETALEGETAVENVDATPSGDEIDDDLFRIAENAGISRAEAEAFGSAKALERALLIIMEREERAAAQTGRQETQRPPVQTPQDIIDKLKFKPAWKPDGLDPELVQTVDALNAHYGDLAVQQYNEITALKQAMGFLVQKANEDAAASVVQEFESFVSGLGSNYEGLFGKGHGRDLDPRGKEYGNRVKLLQKADTFAAGYRARNQRVPDPRTLYQEALHAVFGNEIKQTARRELAEKVQRRQGQALSRPTHRHNGAIDPTQAAIAAVAEEMRKQGTLSQ